MCCVAVRRLVVEEIAKPVKARQGNRIGVSRFVQGYGPGKHRPTDRLGTAQTARDPRFFFGTQGGVHHMRS